MGEYTLFTFPPTKALQWNIKHTVLQIKTFLDIKWKQKKTKSNKELDLLVLKREKS